MANDPASRSRRPSITDQEALQFHSRGRPGKLEIMPTKPMATQRDLSLAYSPGVAVPVLAIAEDETRAYDYTTKGNFVAVITNGTAILGLGNRGALAANERCRSIGNQIGRVARDLDRRGVFVPIGLVIDFAM